MTRYYNVEDNCQTEKMYLTLGYNVMLRRGLVYVLEMDRTNSANVALRAMIEIRPV